MDDDFLYDPIPGITEEKTKQTLEKLKPTRTSPTSTPNNEGKASLENDNSLLVRYMYFSELNLWFS